MPADGILERRLQKLRHKKDWRRLFCKLVSTAIVVYLLFGVIFGIAIVQGDSMTPAVRSGDIVFFLRLGSSYNLGDIVLIRTEGREDYVKRDRQWKSMMNREGYWWMGNRQSNPTPIARPMGKQEFHTR